MLIEYEDIFLSSKRVKTYNPEKRLTILYLCVCALYFNVNFCSSFALFVTFRYTTKQNLDIPNPIKIITRIDNFTLYYIAIFLPFNKFFLLGISYSAHTKKPICLLAGTLNANCVFKTMKNEKQGRKRRRRGYRKKNQVDSREDIV